MQQWLNDPKNRPIVFGIAGCVMVAAIVFILFQLGVIGPQATGYIPSPSTVASTPPPSVNPAGLPPSGPGTPGGPGGPGGRPPAGENGAPGAQSAGGHMPPSGPRPPGILPPANPQHAAPPSMAPGPGSPPTSEAAPAAAPGTLGSPGAPAVLASAPNFRKDPFAPYVDVTKYLTNLMRQHTVRPPVVEFAPPLSITTYIPPQPASSASNLAGNLSQAGQNTTPVSAVTRVSGVMLGTGAYAIIDVDGQSLVKQPGDQLPDGSELTSIQSDSITIKTSGGHYIKVPISAGDNSNQNGPGPQNGNPNNSSNS